MKTVRDLMTAKDSLFGSGGDRRCLETAYEVIQLAERAEYDESSGSFTLLSLKIEVDPRYVVFDHRSDLVDPNGAWTVSLSPRRTALCTEMSRRNREDAFRRASCHWDISDRYDVP